MDIKRFLNKKTNVVSCVVLLIIIAIFTTYISISKSQSRYALEKKLTFNLEIIEKDSGELREDEIPVIPENTEENRYLYNAVIGDDTNNGTETEGSANPDINPDNTDTGTEEGIIIEDNSSNNELNDDIEENEKDEEETDLEEKPEEVQQENIDEATDITTEDETESGATE